ncbi:MAG: hypothetical protein EXR72_22255 [Myxococcales bacterium]|nr:hypothetical protein [Myxococcales bacterium]
MNRTLAYLTLGTAALITLTACRNESGNNPIRDAAANLDLTGIIQDMTGQLPTDMAGGAKDAGVAMNVTIHDIDIGMVSEKTKVTVTGAVIVGITTSGGPTKSSMKCQYSAWVQDPKGAAPAGLKLYLTGKVCKPVDGGSCRCDFPPMSDTPLDAVDTLGDEFTITGSVSLYAPTTDAGLGAIQHEIFVDSMTKTGSGKKITPLTPDPKLFAKDGAGFVNYEGMLVTIKPAQKATVSAPNMYGEFTFGGAQFRGSYRFVYGHVGDGGTFPSPGASFSTITGIADPAFNGGVAPRVTEDFVP